MQAHKLTSQILSLISQIEAGLTEQARLDSSRPHIYVRYLESPPSEYEIQVDKQNLEIDKKVAVIARQMHEAFEAFKPPAKALAPAARSNGVDWQPVFQFIVSENMADLSAAKRQAMHLHALVSDSDSVEGKTDENAASSPASEKLAHRVLADDASLHSSKPLVFISYARPDRYAVQAIDKLIRDAGLRTWLDKKDLRGGDDWEFIIRQRIADAAIIVVCLSTRAVDRKGYFHKEMRLASSEALKLPKGKVFIIPVRIDDCDIPDDLQQWHVVDLFNASGPPALLASIGDALKCDLATTAKACDSLLRVINQYIPFSLEEGQQFILPTKLLGADRCMYSIEVSDTMIASNGAKFSLCVRKYVVGQPSEIVHQDAHGLTCGEHLTISPPWQLLLEVIEKQKACFLVRSLQN